MRWPSLWFFYWGINTHVFQNDEDQYVYLSRWLQTDFPASLWNFDVYGRGLQRLEVWLLAMPAALFDAPWSLIGRAAAQRGGVRLDRRCRSTCSGAAGAAAAWAALPARGSASSCRGPW